MSCTQGFQLLHYSEHPASLEFVSLGLAGTHVVGATEGSICVFDAKVLHFLVRPCAPLGLLFFFP